MEDRSIQTKLMKFLSELDLIERTDLSCSAMAVDGGFSVQISAPGKMLNISISQQTQSWTHSDCDIIYDEKK